MSRDFRPTRQPSVLGARQQSRRARSRVTDKNLPARKHRDDRIEAVRVRIGLKGVCMKKGIMFFLLVLFLAGTGKVSAQEKSAITVKGSAVTNGVVIVNVLKAGKAFELQCNEGASGCTLLKSGKYQMIELPSNTGMYECRDVEIYPDSAGNPETDKKIGEYCLIAQ